MFFLFLKRKVSSFIVRKNQDNLTNRIRVFYILYISSSNSFFLFSDYKGLEVYYLFISRLLYDQDEFIWGEVL